MEILNINQKGLKNKIVNIVASHPKLVAFGIGLAITFVIGTAIGMSDTQQAHAAIILGPDHFRLIRSHSIGIHNH